MLIAMLALCCLQASILSLWNFFPQRPVEENPALLLLVVVRVVQVFQKIQF
jgi:hypothetical protein